jgi:hypothetical protein
MLAHLQPEGDVLHHRHVRKQRVALEHHAGVAVPGRQKGHILAADARRAAARLDEAGDHAQGGGLAAAGRPEQHDELAVGDVERHPRDDGVIAVALGEIDQLEPRHQVSFRWRMILSDLPSPAEASIHTT